MSKKKIESMNMNIPKSSHLCIQTRSVFLLFFAVCLFVPARHMHREYMHIREMQLQFCFFARHIFSIFNLSYPSLSLSLAVIFVSQMCVRIRILQVKKFPSWNQRIIRTFLFMGELKIFSQQFTIKTMRLWLN